MATSTTSGLHKLEIASRPKKSWPRFFYGIIAISVFNIGCLMLNATQFLFFLLLRPLPFSWAETLYDESIRYTKGSFGKLLILMCQWFAPTSLVVTFEREGQGRFTQEDVDNIVMKNNAGEVVSLNLPTKTIVIANHQVYADWWYAWCLTYFMGTHNDVYIVLKKSLKWVPVLGWGMQFFGFIFLARSWASDRLHLAARLSALGKKAEQEDKPLTLILYPEGTLVSKDTRPISKKFADKMGISDNLNTLLPRSTGLQYSLRSLAPRVPNLKMIDMTVVYPGIPTMRYGQDYYTIRSIFMDGVPPPVINLHLKMFDVTRDVPIGNVSCSNATATPKESKESRTTGTVEVDIPEQEKAKFDLWLRELWREKDQSITGYLETGTFASGTDVSGITIPLRLRYQKEIFDAFCFFWPALVGYLWAKIKQAL